MMKTGGENPSRCFVGLEDGKASDDVEEEVAAAWRAELEIEPRAVNIFKRLSM